MPTLADLFSLDPNVERLGLVPRLRGSLASDYGLGREMQNSVMFEGKKGFMPDVIAPKILYDFIRAVKAPGRAARGEALDEEEALNTALNMFGGGLATSGGTPLGSLGMGARVGGKTIRELLYGDKPNLTPAEKSAITRFEKEIQNPTAFEREVMRATGKTQIQPTPNMVMINEIGKHPSYLVDKIIVPVSSDLSSSGGAVSQIAGVPLNKNVVRQGGFHYMLQKPNIEEQVAFASEPSAASSKLANLNLYGDKDVIGVSLGMSPSGTNFSHHVAQGMVRQLGTLKPRPEAIQKLNVEIQNYPVINQETKKVTYPFRDFAGVDSPNIEEQMKGNGELRKAIVEVMGKAEYRKEGFPRYEDTLAAMNNPEFRQGEAGRAMFSAIPGRGLVDPSFQHESYSKGIPGIYQGGLLNSQGQVVGAPVQLLMPKTYERMTKAGKTPHGIARSMQVAHHGEKFTEEALDPLMTFLGY